MTPHERQRTVNVSASAPPGHRLQLYARETTMLEQVARFLQAGLDAGEAGVVVATAPHVQALRGRLGAAAERCTFLDAAQVLQDIAGGDGIDAAAFEERVGSAVRAASASAGRVRAFGEMVALLWTQGRPGAAVELERMWNALAAEVPLSLLCAYPLAAFASDEHGQDLDDICAEHEHVEPAVALPADARRRRPWAEAALMQRERQQAAVARIGHLALAAGSIDQLLEAACRELAQATGADVCGLLECSPDGDELVFRVGHGFAAGFQARVPTRPGTHSGYVLGTGRPVVIQDLRAEQRFEPSSKLLEMGMVSGVSVVVPTSQGPWGTLGVHSRQRRDFTQDDVNFIEAVAHVLGSAIERRRVESELQASRDQLEAIVAERTKRLEQANRELDAFSSAVSHDLRGPVRAIAGFSALLAQRHAGRLDPHGRELLEEVRRAASRMGDLIEDLLDLSRADRITPNTTTVDLSAMAREILDCEALREPRRQVRCEIEPGIAVRGDPDLLHMALENLLSNAWKFTSRTPEACISVSKRREGEEVVVCVQDNGAGFDMADAGRLFQPFQRLHRRSDFDGTGIGLATVRRIIERHGGRIWAQGRPGAGAAFYFALPGLH